MLFVSIYLHSNMVRFIMFKPKKALNPILSNLHSNMVRFIIRIFLDIEVLHCYLHSNMVRFIIAEL